MNYFEYFLMLPAAFVGYLWGMRCRIDQYDEPLKVKDDQIKFFSGLLKACETGPLDGPPDVTFRQRELR